MRSASDLYRFHVANLHEVDRGLKNVARLTRSSIARADATTTRTLTILYALLLGVWSESRHLKLLYELAGFDEAERARIRRIDQLFDRWRKTIELAFRKHYRKPRATLSAKTLPYSAYARFVAMNELLDKDLRPVIELRNKLAHGQWRYTLNSEGDDIAQEFMRPVRDENPLSLQYKRTLLAHIADATHDLVVSKPTFERDFDRHYSLIEATKRNLLTRHYPDYEQDLREKLREGRIRRQANVKNAPKKS